MKKRVLFFLLIQFYLIGCNKTDCSDLKYENGITTLNGKLFTGKCYEYFFNGQIRSEQEYKNGKDNGIWTFYHPAEIVRTSGEFKMGVRIGTWKYFYPNGKIWKINNYDSLGKKVGKWITYAEDESIDTLVTFN